MTEKKRIEELLRESESRLRRDEKLVHIDHYAFDADGGNAIWSDGLKELWSFDRDSNPSFADFIARMHPDDRERVMPEFARAGEAKQGFDFEYRIVRPDGSLVTVHSLSEPEIDEATGKLRYFGAMIDITERKHADLAVRESEARLRRVINATNDGVWDWNTITGETYFSPRWKEILGYQDHELSNTDFTFFERLHPDDTPTLTSALTFHMETGVPMSNEIRLQYKDGSYRWVLNRGEIVHDARGVVIGMAGTITDITERKLATAAVELERDRLRQILDSQFGFVIVLSLDGAIIEVNQTQLAVMGLSRGDVLGHIFWEIASFDPGTVPQVRAAVAAAACGETVRNDISTSFPGTGCRDVDIIFSPLRDAAGRVVGVMGFGVEITDRKHAEEALRVSEELFHALAKIVPVGIFRTDSAGNCIYVNEHYCVITGRNREAALGRGWTAAVDPCDRARVFEEWTHSVKSRESFITEIRILRPDDQVTWVIVNARAEIDPNGEVVGYVGTVTDITERKRAEQQVRRLSSQLLHLQDEERRQIARDLHDSTGQNLAALAMMLGQLDSSIPSRRRELHQLVSKCKAMTNECIGEVRTLSYTLHPAVLDTFGLEDAIRDYVKGFTARSGVHVDLELPPALGRMARKIETALFRVMQESLTNIQRHSGSRQAKIRIHCDSSLTLEIIDYGQGPLFNGPGVSKEHRFPMGVGIPSMQERVRMIGGRFEINSTGHGTIVRVRVPLKGQGA